MKKRLKKKADKMKRAKVHQLLDLSIDINGGLRISKQAATENTPTAFFWYAGHTNQVDVTINPDGWLPDGGYEIRYDALYLDDKWGYQNRIDDTIRALLGFKQRGRYQVKEGTKNV